VRARAQAESYLSGTGNHAQAESYLSGTGNCSATTFAATANIGATEFNDLVAVAAASSYSITYQPVSFSPPACVKTAAEYVLAYTQGAFNARMTIMASAGSVRDVCPAILTCIVTSAVEAAVGQVVKVRACCMLHAARVRAHALRLPCGRAGCATCHFSAAHALWPPAEQARDVLALPAAASCGELRCAHACPRMPRPLPTMPS